MKKGADVSVELWLIRHGETEWSLDGRHTSYTDIPLTEHGRQRALELGAFLRGIPFQAVLVSPRQRARETCELAGLGQQAVLDEGLQEWNYGESEGKTTREMRAAEGNPGWSVWTDPILGGESVEAVGARADGVIGRALAAAEGQNSPAASQKVTSQPSDMAAPQRVALFAHAHILRILAARWIGLPALDGKLFALGTGQRQRSRL